MRALGLRNCEQWSQYKRGDLRFTHGLKPEDIPATPRTVYWEHWKGMGDWLGTGRIANQQRRFLPFRKARAFVRSLRLKNIEQWERWYQGYLLEKGTRPPDIPSTPGRTYRDHGWKGYGDWLGTGTVATSRRVYRPFKEARAFVHSLGLSGKAAWGDFCSDRRRLKTRKPADIPTDPDTVYRKWWKGWGDWLGTGTIAPKNRRYQSFQTARAFARSLQLKSSTEWHRWSRGAMPEKGLRPQDIPSAPWLVYAGKGWAGFGDWLGTGTVAPFNMHFRSFRDARRFARSLGLRSRAEWMMYCKGQLSTHSPKPSDIPANPNVVYRDRGWKGAGDWLGTGHPAPGSIQWRPFRQARAFAKSLRLEGTKQWRQWCAGLLSHLPPRPRDIPSTPNLAYATRGWTDWGNWLGTGVIATRKRKYKPFRQARALVRGLGLRSESEWKLYVKGVLPGKRKPEEIPAAPNVLYRNQGWISWGDFLGTGRPLRYAGPFRPFHEARAFAISLGLRGQKEWSAYCSGRLAGKGSRPRDIPAHPQELYAGQGWTHWGDFLGTGRPPKRKPRLLPPPTPHTSRA